MSDISEIIIKRKNKESIKIILDKEDYNKISQYKWSYHDRGAITSIKRKNDYILLHRLISPPGIKRISFINGNKFDCRKENLSVFNKDKNTNFFVKRRKNLKIKQNNKIEGVYYNEKRKYYLSYVKFNKIQYCKCFYESTFGESAKQKAINARKSFLNLNNENFERLFRINKKIRPNETDKTFEQCYEEIKETIYKRKHNWFLEKYSYISFDDVAIEILAHIHKKWYLWDQRKKNLKNWLNTIISNQIINKVRYYNKHNGNGCTVREADFENKEYNILENMEQKQQTIEEFPERLSFLNNEIKNKLNKKEYTLYVNKILPVMVKILENFGKKI